MLKPISLVWESFVLSIVIMGKCAVEHHMVCTEALEVLTGWIDRGRGRHAGRSSQPSDARSLMPMIPSKLPEGGITTFQNEWRQMNILQ